jgi:hypothetical protein
LPLLLVGLGELDLYSVYAVYAIDEENQNEDKCDLHSILQFRYQRTFASAEIVRRYVNAGGSERT